MAVELRAKHDVRGQATHTVACTVKIKIPDTLVHRLGDLRAAAGPCVSRMLALCTEASSKYYPVIPCVIAKRLIAKYRRTRKCKAVSHMALPLVGDKGRQIKSRNSGVLIPALLGKEIVPVPAPLKETAANAMGNVAVMADPQNGHVCPMGFDPFRTQCAFRHRQACLQRKRELRTLHAVKRKQSRRTAYENHVVSKAISNSAQDHRVAVLVEDLAGVSSGNITRFTQRSNWAFSQLSSFLQYKCALLDVPLLEVSAAYTSLQGRICDPHDKHFRCPACGHDDHRDANAAFNIAARPWPLGCVPIGRSGDGPSAPSPGFTDEAVEGSHATG